MEIAGINKTNNWIKRGGKNQANLKCFKGLGRSEKAFFLRNTKNLALVLNSQHASKFRGIY